MMRVRRGGWLLWGLRLAAGAMAVTRLIGAARAAAPVQPISDLAHHTSGADDGSSMHDAVTVLIPARDEATRISPVLAAMVGAPGVAEVIVVDDASSDDTAAIARAAGARVVSGVALPEGWAGKAWALQQGLGEVRTGWVVTLDADTMPDRGLPAALQARARAEQADLMTVGGRFWCPSRGARWLHPAFLTTLVYRFGPPGQVGGDAERMLANGQCMVARTDVWRGAGGMNPVAGELVEDVSLVRHLARTGHRVAFLDAAEMLTVRMYEDAADTWRGWGRSLALPGVEPAARQWRDLVMLALAQVLPLWRILLWRADLVDLCLAAMRLGTLVGTRRAYTPARNRAEAAVYWLSPAADTVALAAVAKGIVRPRQMWRGRTYH